MSHHPPDCGSRTAEELIQQTEDPDLEGRLGGIDRVFEDLAFFEIGRLIKPLELTGKEKANLVDSCGRLFEKSTWILWSRNCQNGG